MAKACWFSTNKNPLQHRSASARSKSSPHRSDHRPLTRQTSTGDAQNHQLRQRTEFAEHHRLHKTLGVQTFFCDPESPGKKAEWKTPSGAYDARCPAKLTSISSRQPLSSGSFQRLNDTPRKCLDFKTPAEAFSKLKSIVALQT
jgi:IS30 family transposase